MEHINKRTPGLATSKAEGLMNYQHIPAIPVQGVNDKGQVASTDSLLLDQPAVLPPGLLSPHD